MAKTIFEFDSIEESNDINLCANRYKMAAMLEDIREYVRTLNKYEERAEIPTEEIANRLSDIISDWYYIND